MDMLHDTFCTPSTFDINDKNGTTTNDTNGEGHVNTNTNFATSLKFDTLNGPISPQPRSSNSSLTTSSASSYDESTTVDDQKLLVWIQRQLEFYMTLSLLPRFSCIDDIGHGKLLLCLIHRFSPGSLPCLVTTLNEKTSIECLLLADDLAQQLWYTTIDSLAIYLYHQHHHHHQQQQQQRQQQQQQLYSIGDFVDHQLIIPPAFTSQLDSLPDNIGEETDAQLPAATTLPTWQPLTNDVDIDTTASSLTRCWIADTHESIHNHLQHPHTKRLSSLLTLLQQLQQAYVDFTRLDASGNSGDDGDTDDDLIAPTQQLLDQLQQMDEHVITLCGMTATDDDDDGGGGGGGVGVGVGVGSNHYLVDILVQRHACLQSWVRSALCLYQQSSRVQTWVVQRMKHGVDASEAAVAVVLQYQQENGDVLALTEFCQQHQQQQQQQQQSRDWVTHVTMRTVIKTLDSLDSLLSNAKQTSHLNLAWKKRLTQWDAVYTRSMAQLAAIHDSVLALAQQATWHVSSETQHQQSTSLLLQQQQQWKILSGRVAHLGNFGGGGGDSDVGTGYAAVVSMHQQLASVAATLPSSGMDSVDSDYDMFMQQWKQLEHHLESARQSIAQRKRIEDFLHQCHMVQIKATELERQLGDGVNLYQKQWMENQVGELDDDVSRVLALAADGLMTTTTTTTGNDVADLIQYWKGALDNCKQGYHKALVCFRSRCSGLERQQALEAIKRAMTMQVDDLASSVFDPWRQSVDDLDGLELDYSVRSRHFMQTVVNRFNQWIKDGDDEEHVTMVQDVRSGIEKGQQILMDDEHRLDILRKRLDWEQQWCMVCTWIKQTSDTVHALVADSGTDNRSRHQYTLDDIRQQVVEYKHNIDLVQQMLDSLLVNDIATRPTSVVSRIYQRQQLLEDQINELNELLTSTHSTLGQTNKVNAYMSSVEKIDRASKSLGARLDDGLLSTETISDQTAVDQEIQKLETSALQLWQHSGSQIPYPLSFFVVDDLVRWKVLVAYGDVLAALVHLVGDLDSSNKRAIWEKQWQTDMDGLKQGQHGLSTYLQQFDNDSSLIEDDGMVNDTIMTMHAYTEEPLHRLERLFTATQQAYPVNIKMPLALEDQQLQLTVGVCGHVKLLCGLIKYLQTARQLEGKCDAMNATLDQHGVDASEDQVEQWMADTKVHVEQELFGSLCEQQVQVRDGAEVFGKEKVHLVHEKAKNVLDDLQDRLTRTLKESQHTRLVQAYERSATVLESLLHQLQDQLASSVDEHGKMVPGATCMVYQEHEEALHLKWKEAKLALETTHTVSYNDVRCLCQLIQLQKEEADVAARQSRLDSLWQTALQDLQGVHRLLLALSQWRDLSSSLDKVEAMLAPAHDMMDMSALMITTDLASAMNVLPMIYQDSHTTLAALGGIVPSPEADGVIHYDDHNRCVFFERFNHLSNVVDGLLTALLQCTKHEADDERDLILKRLISVTQMSLFDRGSDGNILLLQQWNDLVLKMEQGASKGGFAKKTVDSLVALCDDGISSTLCRDSVDGLLQAVALEKHCSDTFLVNAFACGRQASKLFLWMDGFSKELDEFAVSYHQSDEEGSMSRDWQLDLRLLEYKVANVEKNDMQEFISKTQGGLLSVNSSDDTDDMVNGLGQHVQQSIQTLVHDVEIGWQKTKAQLTEVTQAQLTHLAEQQWQALLTLVDDTCNRAAGLVAGFNHDGNKDGSAGSTTSGDDATEDEDETMVRMMGQEQDLVAAEQSLTILDYEMRPVFKSKAADLKLSLDGLMRPWIGHSDVDNALDKWEQMLQKHKQQIQHGMTMCQYWVAAAEVHGYLFAMEQVIDKNNPEVMVASSGFMTVDGHAIAVELETKHKVYSDALTLSLEKARQVATLVQLDQTDYGHLVTKRNKLEQRYNDRMKEWLQWIGSTNGNNSSSSSNSSSNSSGSNGSTNSPRLSGLRSRKISLPSKMPSPPPPHASTTASTRRRVASSTSSSSSPLLQAQRKIMGRKSSFTNNAYLRPPPPTAAPAPPAPNAYVADPKNDLDMEIGRIVNKVPYKVELQMVPGSAGRYRFGDKVVYCRILKSHMVMVRVGGGWTELSQFLRDHALLVGHGSGFVMQKTSMESCQEAFLETKRATSPTSGRPLPRMTQSTSTSSSISGNAGYKDGDRYIAVDMQGQQHEMKMTPHDSTSSRRR
ncbi:hypothetical protein BCR42DRAFT_223736 [Absidia repens]|uniref:GAR domain-containing protein n=1 Tax=Absidia repens TaxID=90262 RepID=A0A1X2IP39_9FUNG|nr:hypothetical protein BCR42DRAFT_223736 [Absidia repens]